MEKYLSKLMDYQKFENNKDLARIIEEANSRYGEELSDDDLLCAAGGTDTNPFQAEITTEVNSIIGS